MSIPAFWASPFPKTRRSMTSTATKTAKNCNRFVWEKKTLHVHHAFLYISYPSLHDSYFHAPIYGAGENNRKISFSSAVNFDMVLSDSTPENFANIWQNWMKLNKLDKARRWGVLHYMAYKRMCRWTGYGFRPFCPKQGIQFRASLS